MAKYRPGRDPERRKGPDLWWRAARWLAVAGWSALLGALLLLGAAKPPSETFFDRYFGVPLRTWWDPDLTPYVFYVMLFGLVFSLAGLFLNARRRRRRGDEYLVSLILLGVVSLLGIIQYLRFF